LVLKLKKVCYSRILTCFDSQVNILPEENGEQPIKVEPVTPGAGIDLEFETDGREVLCDCQRFIDNVAFSCSSDDIS
jgi:hypothetical protein